MLHIVELMVLGFISLLLTFGQNYIASICVPSRYGHAMSFCGPYDGPSEDHDDKKLKKTDHAMRILSSIQRRSLADAPPVNCKKVILTTISALKTLTSFIELLFLFLVFQDYVALISLNALHQIHIFIFFLAVFHVIYSAITMMLGRAKVNWYNIVTVYTCVLCPSLDDDFN